MFKDRLELLAEKHEYDHEMQARFDYNRWVGQDWKGMQDLSCQTKACSMGWACTIPAFQALGLSLEYDFDREYGIITLSNQDGDFEREEAAAHLFGISKDQALDLFVYGRWVKDSDDRNHDRVTALGMAQAIRSFIQYEGNWAEYYQVELGPVIF